MPFGQICRDLGLSRRTVGNWFHGERARRRAERIATRPRCARCADPPLPLADDRAYTYLLGLYLGDGHLVTSIRVPVLRIYCTVQSYSMHWPCLIPQHGAGKKHERRIELAGWQSELVGRHAAEFVRGLLHSDGCRVVNRVRRGDRSYAYPRYMFSNESADIMGLCQAALDRLGVGWRMCRPNMLSVARREGVARLDGFVGPKW